MDSRSPDTHSRKANVKRAIRRVRSPTRYIRPYRPRFGGKYFRPRFFRTVDDRFSCRPNFALKYKRYHTGQRASLQRDRENSPKLVLKHRASSSSSQHSEVGQDKISTTAVREHIEPCTTDVTRPSSGDRLSFTVSQEVQASNSRDASSTVTRATVRNRAIQRKREEIEEVYRQDCDTFGMVVKMLVAKDPSLERPIQLSLRENLRDIGLRCVEAMEQFIHEYDSREPDISSVLQLHSI